MTYSFQKITIATNVNRILRHYDLHTDVYITSSDIDRVWGWSYDGKLLEFVITKDWNPDDRLVSKTGHGTQFSFREPGGVRPALQVCFHPVASIVDFERPSDKVFKNHYFLEIDFDYASPSGGFWSLLAHIAEVFTNFVTRRKTNQRKISKMLDKRGICK
jgi:hypothetical protein